MKDFFNLETYNKMNEMIHRVDGRSKVITAIAMFYDIEDPNGFLSEIKKILHPEGVFIIQMNYLPLMIKNNAFDNISHEHLAYYTLTNLTKLLSLHELEVVKVHLNDINGGSIRAYIKHHDPKSGDKYSHQSDSQILDIIRSEEEFNSIEIFNRFAKTIGSLKLETVSLIRSSLETNKKVIGYGASTRGNVLLQYYGLGTLIEEIADVNPVKWGKRILGTDIKIISEDEMRRQKPDLVFVLPWYFKTEFLQKERNKMKGTKFVFPLPDLQVIDI